MFNTLLLLTVGSVLLLFPFCPFSVLLVTRNESDRNVRVQRVEQGTGGKDEGRVQRLRDAGRISMADYGERPSDVINKIGEEDEGEEVGEEDEEASSRGKRIEFSVNLKASPL